MSRVLIKVDTTLEIFVRAAGMLEFWPTMDRNDGHVVKELSDRDVRRFDLEDGRSLYVKRYHSIGVRDAVGFRFKGGGISPIEREWRALRRLSDLGVPAPRPAACAEEWRGGLVRSGYMVTHSIPRSRSLEDSVEELATQPARRRRLAGQLGRLLRRMHEGGIAHRDLYIGHVFVDADDRLWLVDLNRADLAPTARSRIKDLAALAFSSPKRLVSRMDRLAFLAGYLSGDERAGAGAGAGALAAAVAAKTRRIRRHVERQVARGRPNFHINP